MSTPTDGAALNPAQVVIHGRQIESLEALRRQAAEAMQTEPGWHVKLGDGSTVTIPHPLFVDDDVQAQMAGKGNVELARLVLGAEQHDRLLANGGRSADVILAWGAMQKGIRDTVPTGPQAGTPTQSSS